MKKKALLILTMLLLVATLVAYAGNLPVEYYDYWHKSNCSYGFGWLYAGEYSAENNNCLAFALGDRNSFIWPWGSDDPMYAEVDVYMNLVRGYLTTTGNNGEIAMFGKGGYAYHFTRIDADDSSGYSDGYMVGKWAPGADVIKNTNLDPYKSYLEPGALIRKYYQW